MFCIFVVYKILYFAQGRIEGTQKDQYVAANGMGPMKKGIL